MRFAGAFAFFCLLIQSVSAATINVPADQPTITAAIAAASPDDVIQLAPGTYNEQVVLTKRLVLSGAGIGQSILENTTSADTGTGILVNLAAAGSTIRDLTVRNFNLGLAVTDANFSGLTVQRVACIDNGTHGIQISGFDPANISFDSVNSSSNGNSANAGRGIYLVNGLKQNISVTGGTYNNNGLVGVDFNDGSCAGVLVEGNTVIGNGDSGIAVLGSTGAGIGAVRNNIVTNNGRFGIEVKGCIGNGQTSGAGSFVVTGNTVSLMNPFAETTPAGRDFAGIGVIQRGTPLPTGCVIVENTVTGYRRGLGTGDGLGIVFEGDNNIIRQNLVSNCDVGIQIQAGNTPNTLGTPFFDRGGAASAANPTLAFNSVGGNTIGIRNVNVAATLNVTRNAWGDISGPTTVANPGGLGAPAVSVLAGGTITFAPWLVYADATVAAGFQIPTTVNLTPRGDTSAADNDYRILGNAIACAATGQTFSLSGTFDWTQPKAAASWALGPDAASATTADNYSIIAPVGVNGVTLTAATAGSATIQGPGDLPSENLEGPLSFEGGLNQNWTISNLRILDFDLGIGMFFGSGGTTAFNGTTIENNFIRLSTDLNATVAPADVNQNIAIHFAFGKNQSIRNNTIEIPGDGISDTPNGLRSTQVGMQSNTSGGDAYDGLQITGNTVRVTGAQSADPSRILGFWENSHGHTGNVVVSGNTFENTSAQNNAALNQQFAFRITSHSGATSTVRYVNNTVRGANTAFEWISGSNFAGLQAVQMINNTSTGVSNAYLIQSAGVAYISGATATGVQTGIGIKIDANGTAKLDADAVGGGSNRFSGFGIGALANNASLFLENTTINDSATVGIRLTGTSLLDAGSDVPDPTGLNGGASSLGNNIFQGYGATTQVIDNQVLATARPRQYAMRNFFDYLEADKIEERVFHQLDDVTKGLVFFAQQQTIPLATSLTLAKANALAVNLGGTGAVSDYEILSLPVNGSLAFGSTAIASAPTRLGVGGATRTVTYSPATTGNDSFTYRVYNGEVRSMPATITITNNAPVASNLTVNALGSAPTSIALVGTDADSVDALIYMTGTPLKGGLTGTAPNLTYRALAGNSGTDSFTYRVFDGIALSAEATVTVTILPTTPPVVSSGATATPNPANTNDVVTLTVAASDPDGSAVSVLWNFGDNTLGQGASVTHIYTAPGIYTVFATVTDSQGETATSVTTVTVVSPAIAQLDPLQIAKKKLTLRIPSLGKDKLMVSGTFTLPALSTPVSGSSTVRYGTLSADITLNSKGSGKNATGSSLKITGKRKKGALTTTIVKFSAKLTGNIEQVLVGAGLPANQSGPVTVAFQITLNGKTYSSPLVLQVTKKTKSAMGK